MPPLILTPGARGADGLSRLSREVAAALGSPTSRVELWSLTDPRNEDFAVDHVSHRGAGGVRTRVVAWSLRETLRSQAGRLVLTLHTHVAPLALPFVLRGARFVHVLVGIECWKPLSRLERAALAKADLLLAISKHSEVKFKEANREFVDRDVVVCHPGIAPLEPEGSFCDESFGLIVGRMSRVERYKGHDLLLEGWRSLLPEFPKARLVVAGDGDDRERLEAKSLRLGLGAAVRFVGRVSDAALQELYRTCSFFVMPSRDEGFGLVFLEAMRAGKACIGAFGAASEIIEDGATGLLVSPDDVAQLMHAVAQMFREPTRRSEMGRRANERFLERFTSRAFQDRLSSALKNLDQPCAIDLEARR